jgi:hypothetical protein
MLQNQPITTPLFQTSLRSWRANYLAQQQAQIGEQPEAIEEPATEPQAQAGPTRVKRLAPRRRKRRQAAGMGA